MAMDLFEGSCTKEENYYVIGLPWKKDRHLLPNKDPLAEQRLKFLERSLSKNKGKAKMHNCTIEEYIENSWAHPLTEEESQPDVTGHIMVFTHQTNQVLHLVLSLTPPPNIREPL